ncbi:hypothetical protein OG216_19495 [Streptomycetaceae bacterium NBC_01309]
MRATISAETASEVFAAASKSTYWVRVSKNLHTWVKSGSYTWSVVLYPGYQALIDGREGYGGTEFLHVSAEDVQTVAIREAAKEAMAAKAAKVAKSRACR